MKDIFISHASEDKESFVRPLAKALSNEFTVWYDEYELVLGASLFEEINKGLSSCDYGVVVLSHSFFNKKWPKQELNALFSLEEKNIKAIFPIWHNITKEEVQVYSPILSDRLAARSEDGVEHVINEIKQAIEYFDRGKTVQENLGFTKLKASLTQKQERRRSDDKIKTYEGVKIARFGGEQTISIVADTVKDIADNSDELGIQIEGPSQNEVSCWYKLWTGNICFNVCFYNQISNVATDAILKFEIFKASKMHGVIFGVDGKETYSEENYKVYIDMDDNVLWMSNTGDLYTPRRIVNIWIEKFSEVLDSIK